MDYRRGEGIALLIGMGIGFGFVVMVVGAIAHIALTLVATLGA